MHEIGLSPSFSLLPIWFLSCAPHVIFCAYNSLFYSFPTFISILLSAPVPYYFTLLVFSWLLSLSGHHFCHFCIPRHFSFFPWIIFCSYKVFYLPPLSSFSHHFLSTFFSPLSNISQPDINESQFFLKWISTTFLIFEAVKNSWNSSENRSRQVKKKCF